MYIPVHKYFLCNEIYAAAEVSLQSYLYGVYIICVNEYQVYNYRNVDETKPIVNAAKQRQIWRYIHPQ